MTQTIYILLDGDGRQIPFMQDLNLDVLITKFAASKLPELTLGSGESHWLWHQYLKKGYRYISVNVELNYQTDKTMITLIKLISIIALMICCTKDDVTHETTGYSVGENIPTFVISLVSSLLLLLL